MKNDNFDELVEGRLTVEQQQLWNERKFMLGQKIQKSARPQICYSVQCFTCQREEFVRPVGKKLLSDIDVNVELLLKGWVFGSRGYECPRCQEEWAEAAVDLVLGMEKKEIEGTIEEDHLQS